MTTADDLLAGLDFPDLGAVPPDPSAGPCWVDLRPFVDGTWEPPAPEIGARRNDGKALLYPGKSHLLVAETGIGKSWFACTHVAAELMAGATVAYVHFEESNAGSTVRRLLRLGVPGDVIVAGLRWVDPEKVGTYASDLATLDPAPSLVVLDGVGAACGHRSQNDPETVNWFRGEWVVPATRVHAAALSIHHPVKDPNRQNERHGNGSGFWLNLVDGVAFRMYPGKKRITRGASGTADIFSVKDRDGGVEQNEPSGRYEGFVALGELTVADVGEGTHAAILAASGAVEPTGPEPSKDEARLSKLVLDVELVLSLAVGNRYESQTVLGQMLRAQKVEFRAGDLGSALMRLENEARLERAEADGTKPRPGWLTEKGLSSSQKAGNQAAEEQGKDPH